MNKIDFNALPSSIKKYINNLDYAVDNIGKSDSVVYIFEDYILKISNLSFDIENEIKIAKALQGKLPIPELLAYEKKENKIYLLKRKLKGKMLCDEEYMQNPDLLFKLATDAVKALWSVDISNLDLQDTAETMFNFGKNKNPKCFDEMDPFAKNGFQSFEEILAYLCQNKPNDDLVLTHGDLCMPNIICDGDKFVGFIDLGLMGIANRYHDIALLYRSIKYNFRGDYGKAYPGFEEEKLFTMLNIKKDNEKMKYFLLLDELL